MTNERGGEAKANRKTILRLSIYPSDNLGLLNPHMTSGDKPEAHPSMAVWLIRQQMTDDAPTPHPPSL